MKNKPDIILKKCSDGVYRDTGGCYQNTRLVQSKSKLSRSKSNYNPFIAGMVIGKNCVEGVLSIFEEFF